MLVQNFNKESSVAQKGFIGWDFDMCFRKLSFFKTKTLLWLSEYMILLSIWKMPATEKLLAVLKGISKTTLTEGVEGRNWSVFPLKSMTPWSYQGRCMQELIRPTHLPGVSEEHMETIGQRQQPTSPTPAMWRNWDLTRELSLQVPVQRHSRRAPAGTALWAGCNAEATGSNQTSEKEELGTKVFYPREPCIFCAELLEALQLLGVLAGPGKICWWCYFNGWVLSHTPSTIWMSGRRRHKALWHLGC